MRVSSTTRSLAGTSQQLHDNWGWRRKVHPTTSSLPIFPGHSTNLPHLPPRIAVPSSSSTHCCPSHSYLTYLYNSGPHPPLGLSFPRLETGSTIPDLVVATSLIPILFFFFLFLGCVKDSKTKKKSVPSWVDQGLLTKVRVGNI